MLYPLQRRLLHWYSIFLSGAILVLICSGGLVTSHGAGMAVPDWPNSFGYNMFMFPISRWIGGVFFEHTHRLIASAVGLFTLILFGLTWIFEDRRWVRWLAGIAVLAVVVQGIIGGLRVTEHNALLGLFHGCLAQGFFSLAAVIALVTSPLWPRLGAVSNSRDLRIIRFWTVIVTGMIFVQLILGASMRHSHTGLAIPDFPTVYGGVLPPMDSAAIASINQSRSQSPTTSGLILLQFIHRVWAVFVVMGVASAGVAVYLQRLLPPIVRKSGLVWLGFVMMQFGLGAWTIWSNKAADIATAHVLFGALILGLGVLLSVVLSRVVRQALHPEQDPVRSGLRELSV